MIADIEREKKIVKVTWVGFFVNLMLTIGKLFAGFLGRSSAMIADGIHSLSDFLTDLVVIVFIKISAKPKDEGHDFGHGKYETLATVLIGLALFAVGGGIFYTSIEKICSVLAGEIIDRPKLIALIAAFVSIACKEILYWYTIAAARKYNSPVVKANAWHHRSDAFSSIGTLIGIGGAYFLGDKWRILDPIAAIVVSLLIAKVAYDLIRNGVNELLERSLSDKEELLIQNVVLQDPIFSDLHNLKTRRIGSSIAIELHVRVNGEMSVDASHKATIAAENRIKEAFGENTQVIVHVEPQKNNQ